MDKSTNQRRTWMQFLEDFISVGNDSNRKIINNCIYVLLKIWAPHILKYVKWIVYPTINVYLCTQTYKLFLIKVIWISADTK